MAKEPIRTELSAIALPEGYSVNRWGGVDRQEASVPPGYEVRELDGMFYASKPGDFPLYFDEEARAWRDLMGRTLAEAEAEKRSILGN